MINSTNNTLTFLSIYSNVSELFNSKFTSKAIAKRGILMLFAFCCLNGLSAQFDLTNEIMDFQNREVNLEALRTTLAKYQANPQDFSLPYEYDEKIMDAIVEDDNFLLIRNFDALIREYFTAPDKAERETYADVLLLAIEETN